MPFIDPDTQFVDPDSADASEVLKKTYAHTIEPGIQYLQGMGPMVAQGFGNIAGALLPGQTAEDYGKRAAANIPQIPATDIGVQKQEALQHYIGKMKQFGGDILSSNRAILPGPTGLLDLVSRGTTGDEASRRGAGEVVGELGPQAMVFGAAGMRPKGRAFTEEQLRQAREDMNPPKPSVPFVDPDFQPSPMPLKPGEQGQLFPEPLRSPEGLQGELFGALPTQRGGVMDRPMTPVVPPELSIEGQLAEQMRQSQAAAVRPQEGVPDMRGPEVREPQVRPTLELMNKEPGSDAKLRVAREEQNKLVEQEVAASMRRGDLKGAEDAQRAVDRAGPPETIDFPLRQEELLKLRSNYERWIKQAEDEGNTRLVEELKAQFESELPDYGVRTPQEALGTQPLFEQGKGTRLPVESTTRPLLGAPKEWNPYAPGGFEGPPKIGGKFAKQAGPGGKQGGAIGFKPAPEFQAFKDKLRDTLKPYAKELWKEMNKGVDAKPTVIENQAGRKAVAQIPGLKNALKFVEPIINKSTEDVLTIAKSEPDINLTRTGIGMTSGAMLTGAWKNSTVVHYVAQLANRAKVAANAAKWSHLLNKDSGLKPLIDQLNGAKNVWRALMENEGKKDLSPEDLKKYSLTDKEIEVAKRFREVFDTLHDRMNQVRKDLFGPNTPDLHRRPGYIPGIFGGDFQGMMFRKHIGTDGKVTLEAVARYGADTRWEANSRRDYYREHFKSLGDSLVVGEVEHRALKPMELRDHNIVYNEIMDLLEKDDPLTSMVQDLQQRVLEGKAYDYAGVKRHFEPKKKEGILGAKGFEPDLAPEKNAQNGLQASLRYAEQAFDWIEMQKMGSEMKKIFTDPEFKANRPNTYRYLDTYWKMMSKQGTNLSRSVDWLSREAADWTGVGVSNVRNTTRAIKSALTIAALTTVKFAGVQLAQPLQMVPTMMAYLKGRGAGGNPVYAFGRATADITAMMSRKGWEGPEVSDLGNKSMKWAEDQHILQSHILDDVRPETLQKWLGGARELAGKPLLKIEEYTRRYAYLQFVHFLDHSGMESGSHMYETASNLTNMSMTDYRMHERPLIYQQLGVVGEAMSTLTPFKHNNYTQLMMAAKKGNRGLMLPTLLASTAMFSGLMGVHFKEDIDNLIHALNDYGPVDMKIPTISSLMLEYLPGKDTNIPNAKSLMFGGRGSSVQDYLMFGGISGLTGMDLSSSFGSSRFGPQSGLDALFPWTSDIVKKGGTAADLYGNPSRDTALAAAHRWLPNQAKFIPEEAAALPDMAVNPETHKGIMTRDKGDVWARRFGGRSLVESRESLANRETKLEDVNVGRQQSILIEMAQQNPSRIPELASKYGELSNDPKGAAAYFTSKMIEYQKQQNLSQKEQMMLKGPKQAERRMKYERR